MDTTAQQLNDHARRITRAEDEAREIYNMLEVIETTQRRHTVRLSSIESKVDETTIQVSDLRTRLGALEATVAQLDTTVTTGFEAVLARLDQLAQEK